MPASVKSATNLPTTDRLVALRFQLMVGELAQRIGARIKQAREEKGLTTQRELAALFSSDAVNNQRISDWERGVNKPSERYLEELSRILEKDVAWFYAGDAAEETPDLMEALGQDQGQLDRIEAKLDAIIPVLLQLLEAAGLPKPRGELGRVLRGDQPSRRGHHESRSGKGTSARPNTG